MNTFKLTIATPDGVAFSGNARSVTVKTTNGDVQILCGHADYLATLGTGMAKLVTEDGTQRTAALSEGFISCTGGVVDVIATTFEFSDNIDVARARAAKERAEAKLAETKDARTVEVAKAKLARALCRISVASKK